MDKNKWIGLSVIGSVIMKGGWEMEKEEVRELLILIKRGIGDKSEVIGV
jgi:hypothetical protein